MPVTIRQVEGRRGIAEFVDVTWQVHDPKRYPAWVPPIRKVVADSLNPKVDPFYLEGDRALFIAYRSGKAVGRIAAVENRAHNAHFGDRVGFFGFFEAIEDGGVARALTEAAEGWLKRRGLTHARGPISPSMHHEVGVLVDGFQERHVVLTPWNPRYYDRILRYAGYDKVKDLLAYDLPAHHPYEGRVSLQRLAERMRKSRRLRFRDLDLGRGFRREARTIWRLYCEAWSENWGFVPPSWEEFRYLARNLKSIVMPELAFVAEADGEPVGFLIIAADINRLLPDGFSGRLTPWVVARLVFGTPRLRSGRLILLGVLPGHRYRAVFPLMIHETLRRGRAMGAERAEASWVLEDNMALRRPVESLGLSPYRRWRIYERPLG